MVKVKIHQNHYKVTKLKIFPEIKLPSQGLFIHDCKAKDGFFEDLLTSCHSLKMLYLFRLTLNLNMIQNICHQNCKTLQTLKLRWSEGLDIESVKMITENCTELTEVSFADTYLSEACVNIVSSSLTPKVMKLSLGGLWEVDNIHDLNLESRIGH